MQAEVCSFGALQQQPLATSAVQQQQEQQQQSPAAANHSSSPCLAAAACTSGAPAVCCNRFVFTRIQKGRQAPATAACFWRSFRPSGPWCFAVSEPPARTSVVSCGAVLSWHGSETTVPAPALQQQQHFRHHQQQQQQFQQLCKQQAQQLQSALCFYQNPEGTSSLGTACFCRLFRPSGPWCFAVSQPPARTVELL